MVSDHNAVLSGAQMADENRTHDEELPETSEPTAAANNSEVEEPAQPETADVSEVEQADAGSEEPAAKLGDDTAEANSAESEGQTADETEPTESESDDEVEAEESADESDEPAEPVSEEPPSKKQWYVVKVTSGREQSIKAAVERRVKIEGLEEFFGQIVIPVERVTEVKKVTERRGSEKITKEKRVIKEQKKYPGYIMAEVEFNEQILFLFRETSGVGDFVGSAGPLKPPPPMTDIEVRRMLGDQVSPELEKKARDVVVKLDFEKGDKVRIREGAFVNMEGEVKEIVMPKEAGETPKVTVEVMIFGRGVPVDLDYWHVDKV